MVTGMTQQPSPTKVLRCAAKKKIKLLVELPCLFDCDDSFTEMITERQKLFFCGGNYWG